MRGRRDDLERRLDDEIRFHIEQQTEKNLQAGMTPEAARRAAVVKFGNVESAREYTRDQFSFAAIHDFIRDLKVAARMWKRSRGAAVVAILTLAIGIGANTAMFSLLNALILNPLPYPEADRLVSVWDSSDKNPHNEVSFANFADWKAQQHSFDKLGLYRWWTANLTDEQTPERVQGFQLTAEAVTALGLEPTIGRWFGPDENEPGKDKVALLGYGLWQRRFGGNSSVLGATITANGVTRRVIGVLPPEMNFPPGADLIAPLLLTPELKANRRYHSYYVLGRMKTGVTLAAANADIATIAAQLAQAYPDTNNGLSARVFPLAADISESYSNAIWLLMASVGFVLLIACANLANVLLARAPVRVRELAVRASMGASRARIVRQLLTESLVLAVIGGSLGAAGAAGVVRAIRSLAPADLLVSVPGLAQLSIDGRVLLFTLALSLTTGLIFGLLPAWRASMVDTSSALRDVNRPLAAAGGHRLRSVLVAAEVALALILLSGAGFTLRAFSRLESMETGFDARNVVTMGVTLPYAIYTDETAEARFFGRLLESAASTPGVVSVGLTSHIPLAPGNATDGLVFEGRSAPERDPEADYRVVSEGYFETIGARIMRGRSFAGTDGAEAARVMVVNEAFVKRFYPQGEALGSRVRFSGAPEKSPWREIVGVVRDIRHEINRPPQPETYIPFTQGALSTLFLVAKTRDDALGMAPALRAAVVALDSRQPVWAVRTLEEIKERSVAAFRATVTFIGVFGGVALFLSAVGIFGVVSFLVSARTQEIGLRMALGARAADVVRLIVAQSSQALAAGLVIGVIGAFALGRVLMAAFPEVGSADPSALIPTAAILTAVSALATWLPARRAAAIDPAEALRAD